MRADVREPARDVFVVRGVRLLVERAEAEHDACLGRRTISRARSSRSRRALVEIRDEHDDRATRIFDELARVVERLGASLPPPSCTFMSVSTGSVMRSVKSTTSVSEDAQVRLHAGESPTNTPRSPRCGSPSRACSPLSSTSRMSCHRSICVRLRERKSGSRIVEDPLLSSDRSRRDSSSDRGLRVEVLRDAGCASGAACASRGSCSGPCARASP